MRRGLVGKRVGIVLKVNRAKQKMKNSTGKEKGAFIQVKVLYHFYSTMNNSSIHFMALGSL